MRKYRLVRELLQASGGFVFEPAPLADAQLIQLVHDPEYVKSFLEGTLDARVLRRIGFPYSEGLVRRTLASVGGTLAATHDALQTGRWGGTLAGGTHHAFAAEGAGFCVFNDIAVAIRQLQREGTVSSVSVIDLDVHQGDGTAAIFEEDRTVFTLSLHGQDNFPLRKQRSSLDIALPDGTGDEQYLRALREALPEAVAHRPQIVFYQSGVDAFEQDTLGRLKLSPEGLAERDRLVFEAIRTAAVPLVVTLGGGYSNPAELTARIHAETYQLARQLLSIPDI